MIGTSCKLAAQGKKNEKDLVSIQPNQEIVLYSQNIYSTEQKPALSSTCDPSPTSHLPCPPSYLLCQKKKWDSDDKIILQSRLPVTFVHFLKPNFCMPTRARNQRNNSNCYTVVVTNNKLHKSHQLLVFPFRHLSAFSLLFWPFLLSFFCVLKQFSG